MSNIIKLKTGSGVPTQNDLVENEVGISTSTYRLYQGRSGSDPVQIGTEIFSGEGVPSDDLGKNGDLYIQLETDGSGGVEAPEKGELEWIPIQGVSTYAPAIGSQDSYLKVDIPLLEGAKGLLLRNEYTDDIWYSRIRLFLYPTTKEYGQPLANGDILSHLNFPFSSADENITNGSITIANNTITFYVAESAQAYYAFVR